MQWNASEYNNNANYVSQQGKDVVLLLAPKPEECILDLGCGDGELAELISSNGCEVLAVDSSPEMIEAAKRRGIVAHVLDAENRIYSDKFDAVFSNAALHWMKDSDRVIKNVYQALKKGGRFCAEMGGRGNVQTIVNEVYVQLKNIGLDGSVYNPWYFPSKQEYSLKLEEAGFVIDTIQEFARPTQLPTNVGGWLRTFAKPLLQDVPENEQAEFIQNVENSLANKLKNDNNEWFADYVRLRFLAFKQG